jgi:hypothetical protein
MDGINLRSPEVPARKSKSRSSPANTEEAGSGFRSTVILGEPERAIGLQDTANLRRLVADRRYFGLDAQTLRAGAERTLARLSAKSPGEARIDARSLGEDFRLDTPASSALQRELLMGGLLHPHGAGGYLPTRLFRQYALACVVAPLTRERARYLIDRACQLVMHVNADWVTNPFQVKMIAVSGSYMSQRDQLSELSLSLVLRRRPEAKAPDAPALQEKDDALRQIVEAMKSLSSFVLVRFAPDSQSVQRPFSVVFQHSKEVAADPVVAPLERFRAWSMSIGRRLASR